ncbi:MAG: guanylate kinase [Rhodospirillales bacterium]|jgi:guanylate kinase|nr:guanylate kinase [Rhodospirillales bacterium]
MLVLSSPSGAGKTTVARRLLDGDDNLIMSVSVTTRPARSEEKEGRDYSFIDEETFRRMVAEGALLEHARVFDHFYGTPRGPVEEAMSAGRDVLFDIDWQGTQQVMENAPEDLVSIFILPPSTEELEKRLRGRAQDSDEVVRRRMSKAADEMSHYTDYDYIIINREIDESVASARAILAAERRRRERLVGLHDFVERMREGR